VEAAGGIQLAADGLRLVARVGGCLP
jgi:hypothetical protein